jgi:hypothetical protein
MCQIIDTRSGRFQYYELLTEALLVGHLKNAFQSFIISKLLRYNKVAIKNPSNRVNLVLKSQDTVMSSN